MNLEKRKEINQALLSELGALIEENPSQRFGQILVNYFFNSNYEGWDFKTAVYYEESAETLANLNSSE